jgi:hypothetical protein
MLLLERELSTALVAVAHEERPLEILLHTLEFKGDWKSRKKVGALGGEEMGTGKYSAVAKKKKSYESQGVGRVHVCAGKATGVCVFITQPASQVRHVYVCTRTFGNIFGCKQKEYTSCISIPPTFICSTYEI